MFSAEVTRVMLRNIPEPKIDDLQLLRDLIFDQLYYYLNNGVLNPNQDHLLLPKHGEITKALPQFL